LEAVVTFVALVLVAAELAPGFEQAASASRAAAAVKVTIVFMAFLLRRGRLAIC
jgi:hypothetical protein